ncbi:hypothetical protein OG775_11785 [Streptomyces platensis]|uniref:hypothetical protein n=1 Tax=Streptomyces platensis TaxID=58346 RepID=UPI00224E58F0|nr:hypothetical protein [Streptomyces platensis]MCX4635807.1 hypothetical protein [Streptomyces platensis]
MAGLSERHRRSSVGLTAGCGQSRWSWEAARPRGFADDCVWSQAGLGCSGCRQCALVAVGPVGTALGPDDAFDVVIRLGHRDSDYAPCSWPSVLRVWPG